MGRSSQWPQKLLEEPMRLPGRVKEDCVAYQLAGNNFSVPLSLRKGVEPFGVAGPADDGPEGWMGA